MSFWPSDAWESNFTDVLKTSVNPLKLLLYGTTPISAILGFIDWSQIPEVWDKIAADPISQLYGSAYSGKLSEHDANLVRSQLIAAGQKQGRTPQQIQQDLKLLNAYISAPVSKGGAGGTQNGLFDAIGQSFGSLFQIPPPPVKTGIWPIVGLGLLILLAGIVLVEE